MRTVSTSAWPGACNVWPASLKDDRVRRSHVLISRRTVVTNQRYLPQPPSRTTALASRRSASAPALLGKAPPHDEEG
jgi:hypothetical protein